MFARAALLTAIFAFLVTLLAGSKILWVRPSDIVAYRELSQKTREIASSKNDQAAKQRRENVCKDIWFAQEDRLQLHTRIESQASTLTFLPSDEKVDIIENLEKIRCWMQDRLYKEGNTPMQEMRYFEAETGTYQYTTQHFLASTVAMSLFKMQGHGFTLSPHPNTAFMQGVAKDVSFWVSGKSPQFHAERFQATLKTSREEALR